MWNFTALQHQRGKTVPLSAILVPNYGQDRMTFLVSQAQPGFGRRYLRTSNFVYLLVDFGKVLC